MAASPPPGPDCGRNAGIRAFFWVLGIWAVAKSKESIDLAAKIEGYLSFYLDLSLL
jgi:hypothetical protein